MKVSVASDHGGIELKEELVSFLESKDYSVINCGPYTKDSVDYPLYAKKASSYIQDGTAQFSVLICTSGVGMSVAANKMKGIRAVLCYNTEIARSSREHNNCNVIVFGQKFITPDQAKECLLIFLSTEHSLDTRHQRRVKEVELLSEKIN